MSGNHEKHADDELQTEWRRHFVTLRRWLLLPRSDVEPGDVPPTWQAVVQAVSLAVSLYSIKQLGAQITQDGEGGIVISQPQKNRRWKIAPDGTYARLDGSGTGQTFRTDFGRPLP